MNHDNHYDNIYKLVINVINATKTENDTRFIMSRATPEQGFILYIDSAVVEINDTSIRVNNMWGALKFDTKRLTDAVQKYIEEDDTIKQKTIYP